LSALRRAIRPAAAAAALLAAGVLVAGTDPDALGEKAGGDTTVYATGRNAFSFPAANLEDPERTRFVIGNSFFRRNWVEAPASTKARDGLGPHFIARSCGGCHVQDGRGEPPEILNRLGETKDPTVALLIRLSIPGQDAHGGPRHEPVYGDQFNNAAIQGVKPEGRVTLRYDTVEGRFADGTPYALLQPRYGFADLGYGPMHPQVMVSPRIAPQVIGVGLLEAIDEADILANAATQAAAPGPVKGQINRVWDAPSGASGGRPTSPPSRTRRAPPSRATWASPRATSPPRPAHLRRRTALPRPAAGAPRGWAIRGWRSMTRPSTTWCSTRPPWPRPRAATRATRRCCAARHCSPRPSAPPATDRAT
jgi:hypothetical protein